LAVSKLNDIASRTDMRWVKPKHTGKIDADTGKAKSALSSLERDMRNFVQGDWHTIVTVSGVVSPGSDQIMMSGQGGTRQVGSMYMGASGGYIAGPGGPRSDSIPAWLSNGEYVINAKSVRRYGNRLFDMLNAGRLAAGGAVRAASGGTVVAGGGKGYDRTVADLLAELVKSFKGEKNARAKANKELERILKQATRNMEKSLKQMVKSLAQSARAALREAKQAYKERVGSIKQGVAGFASVTQTGGTEYVSGAGLLEEMRARMNLAKTFQSQYSQLDKLGLNAKSLKEIVNLGPQEGSKIAAALLEGTAKDVKARIAEVNTLEQAILRIGKSFGKQVANNEGLRKDIREARENLRAVERTEVHVREGAVKVELHLAGVDPDDRAKIKDTVDKAVSQAFRQFIRELKASR
jgi:phage shock protein A